MPQIVRVDVPTKYCKTCNIWRPLRCHHCRTCDNCVETQDHHCVWLNNCVGRAKLSLFLCFCQHWHAPCNFSGICQPRTLSAVSSRPKHHICQNGRQTTSSFCHVLVRFISSALPWLPVDISSVSHGTWRNNTRVSHIVKILKKEPASALFTRKCSQELAGSFAKTSASDLLSLQEGVHRRRPSFRRLEWEADSAFSTRTTRRRWCGNAIHRRNGGRTPGFEIPEGQLGSPKNVLITPLHIFYLSKMRLLGMGFWRGRRGCIGVILTETMGKGTIPIHNSHTLFE